jgi:hypothetical protein
MTEWLLGGDYVTPRDVQLEALRRADGNTGWAHFLDMRLGKTAVALNEFLLARQRGYKRLLVIAPNKYKADWEVEARRAGLFDEPILIFESGSRKEARRFLQRNESCIVVVNYEALISKENMEILRDVVGPYTMIVADESIMIKNPASKAFKRGLELAKLCGIRRALTGKPITQGPHDLWTQLRFIGSCSGWNYVAFRNAFCTMGGFQNRQVTGSQNEERLNQILDSCSWKARKAEWLKTPGTDYMTIRVPMTPQQKVMHDRMDKEFIAELSSGVRVSADQIITKLLKMQQISSGFLIDEQGKAHELCPIETNPKLLATIELIENTLTTKLIVFYHFKFSGAALMLSLAKYNPAWIGSPERNVVEEKRKFNEDPTCRVIVAQIRAAKYGHKLQGSLKDPCFTSLYYENTYSLDDRSQSEERNQGEGQQQPVTLIDFIVSRRDPIVIRSLQKKEDMAAAILRYERDKGVLPYVNV